MKILLVGRNCKVGGGCTFRLRVAQGLLARGHTVELAAQGGPMAPAFSAIGVRFHKVWPTPFNRVALGRILKKGQYDVVHADTPTAGDDVFAVLSKQRGKKPKLVVAVHGLIPKTAPNPSLRGADQLVCFDARALARLREIEGLESRVIHVVKRPVALRAQTTRTRNAPHQIVLVARLSKTKGLVAMAILEAFEALNRQFPGLSFSIVGEGSLKAEIEPLARKINTTLGRSAVELVGQQLDPMPLICGASVVVGGGLVAMEALCHGVPVVASGFQHLGVVRIESLEEAVGCNFGDSIHESVPPEHQKLLDDLTLALLHFDSPAGKRELNALTHAMREGHSVEHCTGQLEAIYHR